ncbi:MAG TPA: RNase adaptor protein RapZ, partial [Ruminococcaceae bacterium]|nr:RNase adaptor protein RapZ [Oscillospiraceae bacterium]
RRRHPLLDECDGCLEDAIREERRLLEPIRQSADYIIDTTVLSSSQLRSRIVSIFEGETTPMLISCISFGFRNGLPQDADLVFDVRCLPNPYYVPELKEHDGTEQPVCDYVMNAPESHEMLQKLEELLAFSIPLYQREGKSQLVVAVGCTGGRHRSVAMACQLAAYLRHLGYRVELSHRDKDRR